MTIEKSERDSDANPASSSRREFFQKAAYIAPVLLTLPASPSFAMSGSDRSGSDYQPPRRWRRWRRWWRFRF